MQHMKTIIVEAVVKKQTERDRIGKLEALGDPTDRVWKILLVLFS